MSKYYIYKHKIKFIDKIALSMIMSTTYTLLWIVYSMFSRIAM